MYMGSSCYHREMNLIGGWMRWWLLRVHFQYCVMAHVSSTWFWAKESCRCMQYKASFNLFDLNLVAVRRSASTYSFALVGRKNVNLSDESPFSCGGSEPKQILRTGNNDHKYLMFCLELSKSVNKSWRSFFDLCSPSFHCRLAKNGEMSDVESPSFSIAALRPSQTLKDINWHHS